MNPMQNPSSSAAPRRAVLATLLAALALAPAAAGQTVIAVNDFRDLADFDLTDGLVDADPAFGGNQTTLRCALENANLIGGWVIVSLPSGAFLLERWGTDDVCRWGDLDVYSGTLTRLEITGAGTTTVVDASDLAAQGFPDRVLDVKSTVPTSTEVVIENLVISGGRGVLNGAGIRHEGGKLILNSIALRDNWANDKGGGVYTDSLGGLEFNGNDLGPGNQAVTGGGMYVLSTPTTFTFAFVIANTATGLGGGMRISLGAPVTLENVHFLNNQAADGAGLSMRGGVQARSCTFQGNSSTGRAGGIGVDGGGVLTLEDSVLEQNVAQNGGGLASVATVSVFRSTIGSNAALESGGGIYNAGTLEVHSSTLKGNQADGGLFGGGGLHSTTQFSLTNTTISGNRAPVGSGGGVYVLGTGANEMSAVTIAENWSLFPGGGVFTDPAFGPTSVTVISTLLDLNHDGGGSPNNFGGANPMVSLGFNLDSDGTCGFATPGDQSGTVASPIPSGIHPLALWGGPTETHALQPWSWAIDSGACHDVAGNVLLEDQRGVPRLSPCDVGAVENVDPLGLPGCTSGPVGCPCGNNPVNPNEGCVHSGGHGMTITATGSTSVTRDNLVMVANGCPLSNTGIFYCGTTHSTGLQLYDGIQCAGGNVRRFRGVFQTNGTATDTGFVAQDPSGVYFVPGVLYFFQFWSRDVSAPSTCGTHANFSPSYGVIYGP